MTSPLAPSRRIVLKGAAFAAAAAVGSSVVRPFDIEAAAAPAHRGIFGYGVASGDPTADAVIIWTRATPPTRPDEPVATPGSGLGAPLRVRWEVARDEDFRHLVSRGLVVTDPASDHTVKIDVDGLDPYTRYYYRFRSRGETSPVGHTQTAPDERGRTHALRFGLVSCSNYTGGYFTAYRALAERNDLDFVLHVGDYIYEYGNGVDRYGPAGLVGVRDAVPATETIDLEGYRLRHALHKADPDLQGAHRRHPWITIFDDHEVANNAWARGAENHTEGTEGAFARRRRQAYRAYLEWMPFRLPEQRQVAHQGIRFFKRFTFGALGDLSVLESRQNRSAQIDVPPYSTTGGGFVPSGIPAVDAQLADPDRHLLEPEQLDWLKKGVTRKRAWHLLANQVILTPIRFPAAIFGGPADVSLLNSDQWDGYQADQHDLITHLAQQPERSGDAVVLTGDIHSSWAMDIPASRTGGSYTSAGVEFVCPSVTSDGFFELVRERQPADTPPATTVAATRSVTSAVTAVNPWVRYLDGIGHGYTLIDVTPDRVQADYYLTPTPTADRPDPRVDPAAGPRYARSWQTTAGSRRVTAAEGPVGDRSDEPAERRPRS